MTTFTTITYVIIAILLLDFVVERGLAYLNAKNVKPQLPDELKDFYDKDAYAKQQAYFKANQNFSVISSSFSLLLILLMFAFGGFAFVDSFAHNHTATPILVSLIFFGILYLANTLLTLPFNLYSQFGIEEHFGFNKATKAVFWGDQIKELLLAVILGGGIIALIEQIYFWAGNLFWFYAWLLIAAFSIFINMFYSNIIVPLFNKQKPLETGELRDAIEAFASKVGFKLNNIYVIDGSKRSTKANAYFSGLGTKKRIVLYDTLINDLTTQEIVAVLAHEVGHYKKKHTLQFLILSLLNSLVMLFLLGLFLNNDTLAQAFGVQKASFHINLLAFGLLYTPFSVLLSILINNVSRHNEYQADHFAAVNGLGEQLISGLIKLSTKSLSNLQPHPAYVWFYYSHPTLLQRINAVRKDQA